MRLKHTTYLTKTLAFGDIFG